MWNYQNAEKCGNMRTDFVDNELDYSFSVCICCILQYTPLFYFLLLIVAKDLLIQVSFLHSKHRNHHSGSPKRNQCVPDLATWSILY
jgi:hypothetical protein